MRSVWKIGINYKYKKSTYKTQQHHMLVAEDAENAIEIVKNHYKNNEDITDLKILSVNHLGLITIDA